MRCSACGARCDPERSFCRRCGSAVFVADGEPLRAAVEKLKTLSRPEALSRPVPSLKLSRPRASERSRAQTTNAGAGAARAFGRLVTFFIFIYLASQLWQVPEVRGIAVSLVRGERPDVEALAARLAEWIGAPGAERRPDRTSPAPDPARSGQAPATASPRAAPEISRPQVLSPSRYGGRVYDVDDVGVTAPRLARPVAPAYPPEARQQRITGTVALLCLVEPDGTVSSAIVTRSLDTRFGLDEAAISAVQSWRYEPARLAGKPVAVRLAVTVPFELEAGRDRGR